MTALTAGSYFVIVLFLSSLVFLAPIRAGDLAGYDDASFAYMAKDILRGTNWIKVRVEHPPLVPLLQAGLFSMFGLSDFLAKLPSALAGLGTVMLVYWLGRRLFGEWHGVVAMVVLATTAYFIKYSARAMTDVPFTFLFLCAVCAWCIAEQNKYWYLAAASFIGLAELTRGLMWIALPLLFVVHSLFVRRSLPRAFVIGSCVLAVLPIGTWYAYAIVTNGSAFWSGHTAWLDRQAFGLSSPDWRTYTGAFEYLRMLAKSYWPWLPFLLVGIVELKRRRDSRAFLLLAWIAVVFLLCAVARIRVLRYMLPAYPAFALIATVGLFKVFSESTIRRALSIALPLLGIAVIAIAIHPPARYHAQEIRPIAAAATAATAVDETVALYDSGEPRWDEASQMQWYGDRFAQVLLNQAELMRWLTSGKTRVFVVDSATYSKVFARGPAHQVIGRSGHLVCVLVSERPEPSAPASGPSD